MENLRYPLTQRRYRTSPLMRELTASVRLSHKQFILPLFVEEGLSQPREVKGLPGIQVETAATVEQAVTKAIQSGTNKFLLFPVPAAKQEVVGDFSFAVRTIRQLKAVFGPEIWLAADCCLCSYTTHGHCGILDSSLTWMLNNASVELISRYAAELAVAGADCIAPSDMTDGRIAAIRSRLDALGYDTVSIMSYAAKFSSQFYGPFRDACHSAPSAGLSDRKTYQHSPFNREDAIASALRDDQEGADILMVKPAALYTDILLTLKQETRKPLAAYHVSGEYAAVESLAQQGLVSRAAAHLEVWAALNRAGAAMIISYAAGEARGWIERMTY